MRTEDLILSLSNDTRAVPRHAREQRVALGLVAGGVGAVAMMILTLGLRPDFPGAMGNFSFWMKAVYTASLALVAVGATLHMARPDAGRARWLWLFALPLGGLALLSVGELMRTPGDLWMPMWLGSSWRQCSMRVVVLALPVFLGLLWAFRALAPTRLTLAGSAAGLAAGAVAATIYGFHCPEVSATFVLTWYTLGILGAAAMGALVGPRVLRW